MIISHIIGGLGNQMFQYALGRTLSLARGVPLKLDTTDFSGYELHQGFQLARVFSVPAEEATYNDVAAMLGWRRYQILRRIMGRPGLLIVRGKRLIVEPCLDYWDGIHQVPAYCYLSGYWQSERYFQEYRQEIRSDFTFRKPLSGQNQEWSRRIRGVISVSLHIRRGDYVRNPETNAVHGLCSIDYYQSAARHIADLVEAPEFFVFSDDISWARENLNLDFPCHYICENEGGDSYIDMQLMSLCRHYIIANSSFSWWGAWLNPRDDKIVVAPHKWFSRKPRPRDLLPDRWVIL